MFRMMASRIQDMGKFVDRKPPIEQRRLHRLERFVHSTIRRDGWDAAVANPPLESGEAIKMFGQEGGDAAEFTFLVAVD